MNFARLRRVAGHRLRSLLDADRADAELAGELAFHLDELVRENLAEGMSSSEARRAARRKLGNVALLEEQCRDQRGVSWLRDLKQDALYAWRMMRSHPGFTAIAAGSLALGIGANTAILGVAGDMLFGNLPYRDPGRLMIIRTNSSENPSENHNLSLPDFFAIQDGARSFESVGCSLDDQKNLGTSKPASRGGEVPERLFGQAFSPGMFETLGVQPLLGRTFVDADYHRGPPSAIVLSYRLWQRRFGADPKILGKRIPLNGSSAEIVGVMPRDFRFAEEQPEYWVPMPLQRTFLQDGVRYYIVAARLAQGASAGQAQGELDQLAAQVAARYPDSHQGWGMRAQPVREALFGWIRPAMLTLEAAVVLVLLIACANVAGLLLARASSRRQEMAMRAALGAGRARIVRQLLAESVMLSALGGVLGVAIAWAMLQALPAIHPPPNAPGLTAIPLNLPMLFITMITSVASGLIFGIGPALAALRQDLTGALKESARSAPRTQRLRSLLVAAQIALACMLLIGSSLLLKSFIRLAGRDLNFSPHGLLTFEFRLPTWQFLRIVGSDRGAPRVRVDPATAPELQRILDRLRTLPGAESVAGISSPPVNGLIVATVPLTLEGASRDSGETSYFAITPGFFATMKSAVVRGREFEERDTPGAPWVAIVNETAARRFFPGDDPLGKRFTLDTGPEERPREVIGVVRDIPTQIRQIDPEPVVYTSYLQQPARARLNWGIMLGQMTFVVRTSGNPMSLAREAQKAVAEIDADVPLARIQDMEQYTGARTGDMFYLTAVLGAFAFIATVLAAGGAYGVMSFHLAQRTREIGIRMALGARPAQIIALVGGRAFQLIGIGLILGLAGAMALTRLLASQLWDVTPTDPVAFAAAFLVLALAAGLACAGPLRRSARVSPARALHGD